MRDFRRRNLIVLGALAAGQRRAGRRRAVGPRAGRPRPLHARRIPAGLRRPCEGMPPASISSRHDGAFDVAYSAGQGLGAAGAGQLSRRFRPGAPHPDRAWRRWKPSSPRPPAPTGCPISVWTRRPRAMAPPSPSATRPARPGRRHHRQQRRAAERPRRHRPVRAPSRRQSELSGPRRLHPARRCRRLAGDRRDDHRTRRGSTPSPSRPPRARPSPSRASINPTRSTSSKARRRPRASPSIPPASI